MPVRTDRGRVAIYRKLWGWPLRSGRNLAVTVVVAVTLGGGVAALAAAVGGSPAHRLGSQPATPTAGGPLAPTIAFQPPATPTAATPTSSAPLTTGTTPAVPPPSPTPAPSGPAAAKAVAGEFMARWVQHPAGMTSRQWVEQLRPYVVPEYVVELASVDPANVPATAVTGPAAVVSATATVVEVNVPTDGGVVHLVVLAQHDGTWRVRSYDLAAG
jgi:hypothetical protein